MKSRVPAIVPLVMALFASGAPAQVPIVTNSEMYSATAIGLGGLRGGPVGITIDRYTTDREMDRFSVAWESGGQKALRRELQRVRIGTIHSGAYGRIPLAVARVAESQGERRIILIAARPIARMEIERALPSRKSLFWRIELNVGQDGTGQGFWEPTAKLAFTVDSELEDRFSGPQRLILSNLRRK